MGSGLRVQGSGFRAQGSGLRAHGSRGTHVRQAQRPAIIRLNFKSQAKTGNIENIEQTIEKHRNTTGTHRQNIEKHRTNH
jgi:hypothetical protein